MSGVSDCKVRVSQVLKADMSGVSKLNYWGTPSTLDVSALPGNLMSKQSNRIIVF